MSARDDYPEAAGPTLSAYIRQHAAMCDEIDRLREAVADASNAASGDDCCQATLRNVRTAAAVQGGYQFPAVDYLTGWSAKYTDTPS